MKTMSIKEKEQLNKSYSKMNELSYRKQNAKDELKQKINDVDACIELLERVEELERAHSDSLREVIELMKKFNLSMAEMAYLYASRY